MRAIQHLERALESRGWVLGKTVIIQYSPVPPDEREWAPVVEALLRSGTDIIWADSAPALRASYAATRKVPIVGLDLTNDPVALGYANSYPRPGKNVTGIFLDAPEFAGKWLEMLNAIVPRLKRVAVLWDPAPGRTHLDALTRAAKVFGVKLTVHKIHSAEEMVQAFAELKDKPQAMVILPSPLFFTHSTRLAELTRSKRLPATHMGRTFAMSGGAISYGPNTFEANTRAAAIIDKILRGTPPGDIPIERPMRFDFMINTKTMKALNLRVPETLMMGAELIN